jgi:DNA-binding NtrC family response regulator
VATANVLIIDDNVIVRQTVVNLVDELGYAAIGVSSAETAQTLLECETFYAVVCDEELGIGLTGTEFLSIEATALPAVLILMSGNPRPPSLPAHVVYLPKPFRISQLEEALTPAG